MTDITNIPLKKLTAWEGNVRKRQAKGSIDELAANIKAIGLQVKGVVARVSKHLDCGSLGDFAIGAFRKVDRTHTTSAQNPHKAVGATERALFCPFEVLRGRVEQSLGQEIGSSGVELKQRFHFAADRGNDAVLFKVAPTGLESEVGDGMKYLLGFRSHLLRPRPRATCLGRVPDGAMRGRSGDRGGPCGL